MSVARYFSQSLRRKLLRGQEPEWLKRHPRRSYIVAATLSAVPWANKKALREMRRLAKERGMVLDHVIPLSHPFVCGLSVPENLRIVPPAVNAAKGNKWMPDQLELIPVRQLQFGE